MEVHHKYSRWNVCRFKPLVWLLITGDSIHNFTDGVALGAAIASSLSLGISTAIAIVLHEIPHELGKVLAMGLSVMCLYPYKGMGQNTNVSIGVTFCICTGERDLSSNTQSSHGYSRLI